MTVANQTNRTAVTGNGAIGQVVPFTFPISVSGDIEVIQRVTATGVETVLAETTNYTVTDPDGASDPDADWSVGGNVTTVTAVAVTAQIHVIRKTPKTQTLDLTAGAAFSSERVEGALDRNTRLIIENADALDRTLRFPDTDPIASIGDMPNSIDRASKWLYFGDDGVPTAASSVTPSTATVSGFMETVIDDAGGAEGLATIFDDLSDAERIAWKVRAGVDHVYDVRDYGATGDGETNDTVAIQAAIDAIEAAGKGVLYLPPGAYSIQTTLVFNKTKGIIMHGSGKTGDWRTSGGNTGTVLAWDGADDGTLFQFRGCIAVAVRDMQFTGKDETDNTKTDILVSIANHADGTACGDFYFTNCSFMHAEAGIQCANAIGDGNASPVSMKDCGWKNCVSGFLVKNTQGIQYTGSELTFSQCDNAFYFEHGGVLTVRQLTTGDTDWVLKLGRGGRNVAVMSITGGHAEMTTAWADAGNRPGIINCASDSAACSYIVNVTGFSVSSEDGVDGLTPYAATYTNELNEGVVAIFNGCIINAYDFANIAGDSIADRTQLILNNCKFWESNVTIADYIKIPNAVGAHDGGNNEATVMTDSGEAWTADELIGRVIINKTDGSYGTITDNDATSITVASLAGGTDNDWDTGDVYFLSDPFFNVELNNCSNAIGRPINYSMPTRLPRNDATPDVSVGTGTFLTGCSSATSITGFDHGGELPYDGETLTIIGGDGGKTTITDGASIGLDNDATRTLADGEILVLKYDAPSTIWREVTRSNRNVFGTDGVAQGTMTLWDGPGGVLPGWFSICSANGTRWYFFVTAAGELRFHNAPPTADTDGTAVKT